MSKYVISPMYIHESSVYFLGLWNITHMHKPLRVRRELGCPRISALDSYALQQYPWYLKYLSVVSWKCIGRDVGRS